MMSFDHLIKTLIKFKEVDDRAELERHEKLRLEIMRQARRTKQDMPVQKPKERRRFLPHYAYNMRNIWPKMAFDPKMDLAYGTIVLVLGLLVGQQFATAHKTVLAQSGADRKISVMAMAEPWEGWIEGGE